MDEEIEIRKVAVERRQSIPAIAVTAIIMALALAAIIALQVTLNAPARDTQTEVQTQPR